MKAIDPVCGMTIETENAFASSSYKGTTYYFCSAKCEEEFAKDPETILAMDAEREKMVEKERSKSLEKMMDQVAHEIRNPLTSIGGFIRRMYERLPDSDPNREYMRMIIQDITRLESMIKQLVEMKAIGMSRTEYTDVNDIIRDVLKAFGEELRDRGIEVKTELAGNPSAISADSNKVAVAIGNLIKNSIEAMESTPRVLKIVSCVRNDYIEIVVSDTGKGIPEDEIRYIFDPFFTSKIYGPGLGLTIARKIFQEYGGTVSVESRLGRGTTFTIRLPLK